MKKIKKFLVVMAIGAFVVVAVWCANIGIQGYQLYREAVNEISVEDKVALLRADDQYVPFGEISPSFLDAIVAIEDKRFYRHGGINPKSIGRAVMVNLQTGNYTEGGSTITQQFAKNIYFSMDKELTRKVAEVFVAWEMEKKYSKEDILELYVNVIYFGDGYIGVRQASLGYFSVEPKELTIGQATLLAGLPQAPSAYALSKHLERAYDRQEEVLAAMVENNYLTEEEAQEIMDNKVIVTPIAY